MLAELHQKLDALAAQVQYLAEQAKQERQARDELFDTLMPILNDALRLTGKQLAEVQADVQLPDLVRLLKRLARNRQNIERLLDLIEASFEFTDVLAPVGNEVFAKLIAGLSEAERRGYFVFARGGLRVLDEIVTSFGEEDIKQLGDNIVLILQTIKQMTQPEVMNFLRRTIVTVEEQAGARRWTSLTAPCLRNCAIPTSAAGWRSSCARSARSVQNKERHIRRNTKYDIRNTEYILCITYCVLRIRMWCKEDKYDNTFDCRSGCSCE
jgi:hypothetical protein